jgi:hypothetical protein
MKKRRTNSRNQAWEVHLRNDRPRGSPQRLPEQGLDSKAATGSQPPLHPEGLRSDAWRILFPNRDGDFSVVEKFETSQKIKRP